MTEYIEREAATAVIEEKQKELCPLGMYSRHAVYGSDREKFDAWQEIIDALESIPAADVRPVVRGKWILYKDRDSTGKFEYVQWSCSACKSNVRTGQPRFDSTLRERPRFNYCPNCGADMREES